MKSKISKILCLLLSLVMVLGFVAACGDGVVEDATPTPGVDSTPTPGDVQTPAVPGEAKTLMVGYTEFSERFSPFFATSAYDRDVSEMTQVLLLTTDRVGDIVFNAINGETRNYNGTDYFYRGIADFNITQNADGTVDYDVTIRDDLVFSDGVALTIDDVIFNFYVKADPDYDGSSTFYSAPIIGMNEFRTGVSSDTYAKYFDLAYAILEAGPDNDDFSNWSEELAQAFWANFAAAGSIFAQDIIDYCIPYAGTYSEEYEAVYSNDVAFGMMMWGFGEPDGDTFITYITETEYDMAAGEFPTSDDYWNEIVELYGYDLSDSGIGYEAANADIEELVITRFVMSEGPKDPDAGGAVMHIEGLQKTGDYSLRVTTESFDATTIYRLDIEVAPLHYYGDVSLYDYDNNMFGFTKGDLTIVREKTTVPMGAGAYKFLSYQNGVVSFEANPYYYKGEPKTKYIQFQFTPGPDKLAGVVSGSLDLTDPSFSDETVASILDYNSNGELTGNIITTKTVDNLGYGYIGIAADTISVGGEPSSEASKNLRRALATVFSVYRDTVNNSYYGERASTIQYPISNTSWAAPRPSDDGYMIAFSVDVDGNSIYTDGMTEAEKFDAALEAAIGFLKAAGYTWDEASGMFTEAPEGASLVYSYMIGADGVGDHPAYGVGVAASDALATIGITLDVQDVAWSILEGYLNNGGLETWAAAWQAAIDPDMYQIYHSSNTPGGGGTGSNSYFIQDAELDLLMLEARTSADQAFRKATYKRCLEIIIDWAVEVPNYQRLNAFIFSTERVKMETVTPDITTFWDWRNDIELIEVN
ncbi:MAG: ABC transporter substrate-binding protein [Oscillospiraceae bacterium]|nr:ABC transporter substrate-binding protein [Oscillospiraceae bacterium]